jgi:protein-disulfide isomerase
MSKLFTLLSLLLFLTPALKAEDTFSPTQRNEVVQIVQQTLEDNPEMIIQAVEKGLQKKQDSANSKRDEIMVKYSESLYNDPNDPVEGNPKGSITMVVFEDPYCGYCRKFDKVLKKVAKERSDVRIVYKMIPVLGEESSKAAYEEIAANMQGKFLAYKDALYSSEARTFKQRKELAKSVGLDIKKWEKDRYSGQVKKTIRTAKFFAEKLGISATPTFIINGTIHQGYVEFDQLDELLKKN